MEDNNKSVLTNESALVPVIRSIAKSLLVERSVNVGSKLLQGKPVKENDVSSLTASFILFLLFNSN